MIILLIPLLFGFIHSQASQHALSNSNIRKLQFINDSPQTFTTHSSHNNGEKILMSHCSDEGFAVISYDQSNMKGKLYKVNADNSVVMIYPDMTVDLENFEIVCISQSNLIILSDRLFCFAYNISENNTNRIRCSDFENGSLDRLKTYSFKTSEKVLITYIRSEKFGYTVFWANGTNIIPETFINITHATFEFGLSSLTYFISLLDNDEGFVIAWEQMKHPEYYGVYSVVKFDGIDSGLVHRLEDDIEIKALGISGNNIGIVYEKGSFEGFDIWDQFGNRLIKISLPFSGRSYSIITLQNTNFLIGLVDTITKVLIYSKTGSFITKATIDFNNFSARAILLGLGTINSNSLKIFGTFGISGQSNFSVSTVKIPMCEFDHHCAKGYCFKEICSTCGSIEECATLGKTILSGTIPLPLSACYDGVCKTCYGSSECLNPIYPVCNKGDCVECVSNYNCTNTNTIFCNLTQSISDCFYGPNIKMYGPPLLIDLSDIDLRYNISGSEWDLSTVSWSLQSSSSDSIKNAQLLSYLQAQTVQAFTVPGTLLERDTEYNFSIIGDNILGNNQVITLGNVNSYPSCTPGKYLIRGSGCSGVCPRSCVRCYDRYYCSECASYATLTSSSSCQMNSFLLLDSIGQFSACTSLNLRAMINNLEFGQVQNVFKWTYQSSVAGTSSELNDYFANQTDISIQIPGSLFVQGEQYQINASYINNVGVLISNITTVTPVSDLIPSAELDGGIEQIIVDREAINYKKLRSIHYGCFTSNNNISVSWEQTSGLPLVMSDLLDSSVPNWLIFPQCILAEASAYSFRVEYWIDPAQKKAISFTVKTQNDKWDAKILNGNREFSANQNLIVNSSIVYRNNCSRTAYSGYTDYRWQCRFTRNPVIHESCNHFMIYPSYVQDSVILLNNTFRPDDIVILTLTIIRGYIRSTDSTTFYMGGPRVLPFKMKCLSQNCDAYDPFGDSFKLEPDYFEIFDPSSTVLSYEWTTSPKFNYAFFYSQFFSSETSGLITNILRVSLRVSNSTHSGFALYDVKTTSPPSQGSLSISPTSGEALSTYFNIKGLDFLDVDIPLSFQFYYALSISSFVRNWQSLGDAKLDNNFISILPYDPLETISIRGVVRDRYGAATEAFGQVEIKNSTVLQTFESYKDFLAVALEIQTSDPVQKISELSIIENQLRTFEVQNDVGSGCPNCSGQGNCLNSTKCQCNSPDLTGSKCNIVKTTKDLIISSKFSILNKLVELYFDITRDPVNEIVISTLSQTLKRIQYVDESLIDYAFTILNSTIDVFNPEKTVLNIEEKTQTSSVLASSAYFEADQDCYCDGARCQNRSTTFSKYFDMFTYPHSQQLNPGISNQLIVQEMFTYLFGQTVLTTLLNTTYIVGSQKVSFSLKGNSQLPEQIVYFRIITITNRTELFTCRLSSSQTAGSRILEENKNLSQSLLGVEVRSFDQKTLLKDLNFQVKGPTSKKITCPKRCRASTVGDEQVCDCPDFTGFDFDTQFKYLFSNSDFSAFDNIDALSDWPFYKSPVVYIYVFIVTFLGGSFMILKIANLGAFCVLENAKKTLTTGSLKEKHPLLNIFMVKTEKIAKPVKVLIYVMRVCNLGVFTSLFMSALSSDSALDQIQRREIVNIIFPYITMLPFNLICEVIFKRLYGRSQEGPKKLIPKIMVWSFLSIIVMGSALVTFIVAANRGSDWESNWSVKIAINFLSDLIITPVVAVGTTLIKAKHKQMKNKKKVSNISDIAKDKSSFINRSSDPAKLEGLEDQKSPPKQIERMGSRQKLLSSSKEENVIVIEDILDNTKRELNGDSPKKMLNQPSEF